MLLMNVLGLVVARGVSTTYTITVGNEEASDSVMMVPEADQVNISICPGVSKNEYLNRAYAHQST